VPVDAVAPVRAAPPPTPDAVAAAEAVTDHDVIAFLTAWADNTSPREAAAFVHFGMTSSDLLDTALARQLTDASDLLIARATELVAVLREHGLAHAGTLRVGRTHGIHAEPDVWGHRVADFAFAVARCRDRLVRAREAVAVGKLSGPVGTYSNIDPAIEAAVLPRLGLRPADVATQVVFRDGIADWVSVLALLATACDAIALEIRHCQRTEVRELAEPFAAGQKGSSAMPHKKNPVDAVLLIANGLRAPGLLATVHTAALSSDARPAGEWHAEWQAWRGLLRIAVESAEVLAHAVADVVVADAAGTTVDATRVDADSTDLASAAAVVDAAVARFRAYADDDREADS
jgi:adenylosuccinate lyase